MPVNAKISLRGDRWSGYWFLDIELEDGKQLVVSIGGSAAQRLEDAGIPDESPGRPKDDELAK